MNKNGEIILTGFGPFGEVTSNPTEKLIHSLKEELQDELYHFYILPVSYSHCSNWSQKHISDSSSLVIHFGVSSKSEVIQLERTGRNIIGSAKDVDGNSQCEKILEGGPRQIQTKLDLQLVCNGLNYEISDDAGDYLCNFIYYKSLLIAPEKSLFVHVPPEEVLSIEELKMFTLQLLGSLRSQVE